MQHKATVDILKLENDRKIETTENMSDRIQAQLSDMKQQILSIQTTAYNLIQEMQTMTQTVNQRMNIETMVQTVNHKVYGNERLVRNFPDHTNVLTSIIRNLSALMETARIKPKHLHQRNSPSPQQRRQSRRQTTPTRQTTFSPVQQPKNINHK